jgi:hypothetical protein
MSYCDKKLLMLLDLDLDLAGGEGQSSPFVSP